VIKQLPSEKSLIEFTSPPNSKMNEDVCEDDIPFFLKKNGEGKEGEENG
jgi:hypothetical protein